MANDKVSYTYDGQVLGIVPRSTKISDEVPQGTYTFFFDMNRGLLKALQMFRRFRIRFTVFPMNAFRRYSELTTAVLVILVFSFLVKPVWVSLCSFV